MDFLGKITLFLRILQSPNQQIVAFIFLILNEIVQGFMEKLIVVMKDVVDAQRLVDAVRFLIIVIGSTTITLCQHDVAHKLKVGGDAFGTALFFKTFIRKSETFERLLPFIQEVENPSQPVVSQRRKMLVFFVITFETKSLPMASKFVNRPQSPQKIDKSLGPPILLRQDHRLIIQGARELIGQNLVTLSRPRVRNHRIVKLESLQCECVVAYRKEILETQLRLKHLILIKQERRVATKPSLVKGVGNALHDLHCAVGMVILQGVDLGKRGHDSRQSHHRRPALATQSRQQDENHKKMPTLHEFYVTVQNQTALFFDFGTSGHGTSGICSTRSPAVSESRSLLCKRNLLIYLSPK